MTEVNSQQNQDDPRPGGSDDEINLLDLLLVLARRKMEILGICAVTFVLACAATLLMPNVYTATARIMPPQQEKLGLSAMLGGMSDLAALAGLSLGSSSSGLYVGMLQSRSAADAVIDRLDLMRVYEWKTRAAAYKALRGQVRFTIGKGDGIIAISADEKDPELAAALANAYVEALKNLNMQLSLDNVSLQKGFLENRIKVVKADLAKAEEALKEFQTTHKAIRIDAQATAIIEAIAKLKGELASLEVELGVLLTYQTEQNPQVKAVRESIAQIKGQLQQLEKSPDGQKAAGDIFIATSDVPDVGLQYARLLRDFKVQETLYELLTKQFEVAKIEAAKNISPIQVLDPATVPDMKSKPRRSLIVLLMTFSAGFLSVIGVLLVEYGKRLNDDDRQRWEAVKQALCFRRRQA